MTFVGKTGMGVKSPSFTPHTEKSLQSERNEDSAPQHLPADVAAQGGASEATETLIGAVRVPLPGGLFALVDAADAERVLAHRWRARRHMRRPGLVYVQRHYRDESGVWRTESLHRFLLGCSNNDGKVVDHRNSDTLDNRRCNLRLVTHSGNSRNRRPSDDKLKGICWSKPRRVWVAKIRAPGKKHQTHLGEFNDPIAAAEAYDEAARNSFGEHARTNFQRASAECLLLGFIAAAAFRKESVILARFPMAGKALSALLRDGLTEYHDDACTAVHITAAGRAELRRLREAQALRGAA